MPIGCLGTSEVHSLPAHAGNTSDGGVGNQTHTLIPLGMVSIISFGTSG